MARDREHATPLAYGRSGSGEPLVLVHANGMSRAAWAPVLPSLERHHDVIRVDLPGHGESPPIPPHLAPAPPAFARLIADLLAEMGIERPHMAGNSLGGWTAFELAKLGRARSACALGPAGLWRRGPIRPMFALALSGMAARNAPRLAQRAISTRTGRALLLRHAFGHPSRIPPSGAARIAADLANAAGFLPTLVATHTRRFMDGGDIDVPVTVVFGRLDRVVPHDARIRDELPDHTRWIELADVGHVPMWDDPEAVARTIIEAAAAAS